MPVSDRKEREKQKRRDDIIKVAKRLFREKGFTSTSMQDIAAGAELAKGTLYLYFKNKDELVGEILYESVQVIARLLDAAMKKGNSGFEKLRSILYAYLDFRINHEEGYFFTMLQDYFPHIQVLSNDPRLTGHLRLRYQMVKDVLETGIRDGSIRPDINPGLTAVVLTQLATASMLQRIFPTIDKLQDIASYSIAEMTENLIELVAVSLKNSK